MVSRNFAIELHLLEFPSQLILSQGARTDAGVDVVNIEMAPESPRGRRTKRHPETMTTNGPGSGSDSTDNTAGVGLGAEIDRGESEDKDEKELALALDTKNGEKRRVW